MFGMARYSLEVEERQTLKVQQEIWHCLAELGMSNDLYGSMGNFGHSTNFRRLGSIAAWVIRLPIHFAVEVTSAIAASFASRYSQIFHTYLTDPTKVLRGRQGMAFR